MYYENKMADTTIFFPSITVNDVNNNRVGELRTKSSTEITLGRILVDIQIQFSLNSDSIEIAAKPVRNRYAGNQKCDLYIEVKAQQEYRTSVEKLLDSGNISYQVEFT